MGSDKKTDNENVESLISSDLGESKEEEKSDSRDGFSKVFSDYKRQSAGVISEVKRKEMYLKPSVRRKLKAELARKKRNKRRRNPGARFGGK